MTSSRQEVFAAIDREREYQERKWKRQHSLGAWLTVLRAELAEAEAVWVKCPEDGNVLCEILQVAAVAVAALEQHGLKERE